MMSVLRHGAQPHGHANQPIAHDTLHLTTVFQSQPTLPNYVKSRFKHLHTLHTLIKRAKSH